jgi:acetolactate synthase-1/2/3 large subunit
MLARAERPYVYAGAGVLWSEASAELVELAELLTLPVATTLNGKSGFPESHPLSLGIGGFARARYGTVQATRVAEAADVVMTIGCGFKQPATLAPMPGGARHIQVDIDATELHKETQADLALLGDAKLVLRQMIDNVRQRLPADRLKPRTDRIESIAGLRRRWDDISRPLLTSDEAPLNPFRVTKELSEAVDRDNTIVLHDAGSVRGTTCQHYIADKPRSFIGFGVQSAMGWSIGAAIGAKLAAPAKLVVAVIGEEAFTETALDLETSVRCGVPVLILVLNNRAFTDRDGGTSARLAQARFGSDLDICDLSDALGARTYRVARPDELSTALKSAIADVGRGTTAVVECMTCRVRVNLALE